MSSLGEAGLPTFEGLSRSLDEIAPDRNFVSTRFGSGEIRDRASGTPLSMHVPARIPCWSANDAVACFRSVGHQGRPHDIAQPTSVTSVERCRTADKLLCSSCPVQSTVPTAIASRSPYPFGTG